MNRRVLPLLSLILCLAGCATPARNTDAQVRARGEAARQRYWRIQAENARPAQP